MGFRIQERRIRIGGHVYVISRRKMAAAAAAGICLCIIAGAFLQQSAAGPSPAESTHAPASDSPAPETAAEEAEPLILVHVAGAVKAPGLVRLFSEARIADAIAAAGGAAESADFESLNLASPVYDGMKLYVPRIGETPGIIPPATPEAQTGIFSAHKININTAGLSELMQLDGIGEVTAGKIIAYREQHGKFQKEEELMDVSGIGNAKYEKIKDKICV